MREKKFLTFCKNNAYVGKIIISIRRLKKNHFPLKDENKKKKHQENINATRKLK